MSKLSQICEGLLKQIQSHQKQRDQLVSLLRQNTDPIAREIMTDLDTYHVKNIERAQSMYDDLSKWTPRSTQDATSQPKAA